MQILTKKKKVCGNVCDMAANSRELFSAADEVNLNFHIAAMNAVNVPDEGRQEMHEHGMSTTMA